MATPAATKATVPLHSNSKDEVVDEINATGTEAVTTTTTTETKAEAMAMGIAMETGTTTGTKRESNQVILALYLAMVAILGANAEPTIMVKLTKDKAKAIKEEAKATTIGTTIALNAVRLMQLSPPPTLLATLKQLNQTSTKLRPIASWTIVLKLIAKQLSRSLIMSTI